MANSNQKLQETILEFPKIDKDNIEYFLQFWEDINFDNI